MGFVHVMAFNNYENRKGVHTAYDSNTHSLSHDTIQPLHHKKLNTWSKYPRRSAFLELWVEKKWGFSKQRIHPKNVVKKLPQQFLWFFKTWHVEFRKNICSVLVKSIIWFYVENEYAHIYMLLRYESDLVEQIFLDVNLQVKQHASENTPRCTAVRLSCTLYNQVNLSWKLTRFPAG